MYSCVRPVRKPERGPVVVDRVDVRGSGDGTGGVDVWGSRAIQVEIVGSESEG